MEGSVSAIIDDIKDGDMPLDELAMTLESANHEQRMELVRGFSEPIQRELFDRAEGRDVTLDQLVPPSKGPLEEVIHEGQNTLPVFSSFQKRFCRPPGEYEGVLWGYNEQSLSFLTGPGYYVAYEEADSTEVAVDYTQLPEQKPDSWPTIVDNNARLGRFVYAGMVDRLRRLSEHVTIGRAYKGEPMDQWFVLVRRDD